MARTYYKIIQRKSDGFYKTSTDWSENMTDAYFISTENLGTILDSLENGEYVVLEGLLVS